MPSCPKDFLKDITDPVEKFERETLISDFLSIKRIDIYLENYTLSPNKEKDLRQLIERRLNGEPLQYILGYTHFRELKIEVGPGVLIPRPETEKIIDIAKEFITPRAKVIDVGTGSGAIALSVAKEFPQTDVIGVDISNKALNYALKNQKLNDITNCAFKLNDLCSGFAPNTFDLVLANLPYIPYLSYTKLDRSVKDFEPQLALTPGQSGLELIEKLIHQTKIVLKPRGIIILEIDKDQGEKVRNIFKSLDVFSSANILKDYNALDRFVLSQKIKQV